MRVLFFGLPAGVSADILAGLANIGHEIAAVVVPGAAVPHLLPDLAPPLLPLSPPTTPGYSLSLAEPAGDTLGLAWGRGWHVLAVRSLAAAETHAALTALLPEVGIVGCFTRRIPPAVLTIPRHGVLNWHPSLLPTYRGPQPLFWQLRDGAPTGVTIHYLNEELDTGDIAAQTAVALPDGVSGPEAERRLASAGVELLRGVLDNLAAGVAHRRAQPPGGSYQHAPTADDYRLDVNWPARRAFNFMRGTADRGQPYPIEINGRMEWLDMAYEWTAAELDRPSVRHGRQLVIRFSPGVLYARLAAR